MAKVEQAKLKFGFIPSLFSPPPKLSTSPSMLYNAEKAATDRPCFVMLATVAHYHSRHRCLYLQCVQVRRDYTTRCFHLFHLSISVFAIWHSCRPAKVNTNSSHVRNFRKKNSTIGLESWASTVHKTDSSKVDYAVLYLELKFFVDGKAWSVDRSVDDFQIEELETYRKWSFNIDT